MLPALTATAVAIAIMSVLAVGKLRSRTLYSRVAAIAAKRSIKPRVSFDPVYRECDEARSDSTIPDATCGGAVDLDDERMEEISAEIHRRTESGVDADALYAEALLDLVGPRAEDRRPARAITSLMTVMPLTHDSARVMVDLSAAYLVLGGDEQLVDHLLAALDWSDRALAVKPDLASALFNRALALDALTADVAARTAYQDYLRAEERAPLTAYFARDHNAEWRREAQRRLRELEAQAPAPVPGPNASDRELAAFAVNDPQGARELATDILLPRWGRAILSGDSAVAARLLRRAGIVGSALVEGGGDALVHDQVSDVQAMLRGGTDVRDVAAAYRLYGTANAAKAEMQLSRADSLINIVEDTSLATPHRIGILLTRAAIQADRQDQKAVRRWLASAEAAIGMARYPAAAARISWLRATLLSRTEAYAEAVAAYKKADAAYARLGEDKNRGAIAFYISDCERHSGDLVAANRWLRRSVVMLRGFGYSKYRHYAMKGLAEEALSQGLHRAMRDMADEDVAMAEQQANPVFVSEARFARAVLLAASGAIEAALQALREAGPTEAFTEPAVRAFLDASEAYVKAQSQLRSAPDSVFATVRPLVGFKEMGVWRFRGFALRAQAYLARGNTLAAVRDLNSIFVALEHGRDGTGGASDRKMVEGDVRTALHFAVRMLAPGHRREALNLLQRGDAALSTLSGGDAQLPLSVPADRVIVRPLVVGDTLLVWTMAGTTLDLSVTRISHAGLSATIDSVDTALTRPWNADVYLSRLYEVLLRPVEGRLGQADTELVFVHDADLAGVPWAALRDSGGRPLVERHPVWRAVSVAAAGVEHAWRVAASAAFSAPPFDPDLHPGLDELTEARAEVGSVSAGYPSPFTGAHTPGALKAALERYELVHFAGHAVVNNTRPERSYLVLAADSAAPTGALEAEAIERLHLRGLRLVVLSACSTLGGDEGSSGFTGLSGALLGAGAHGVVGSLWKVDDEGTREFMEAFHESYRTDGNPVRALRHAQLVMLQKADPVLASPSTWAAFQYVAR
ncbi:MAG TPA: CHAT domain-containing protein [Longimicrobium sp.]|nr:CHAT domain-containing protein [Longimicrobium sp.]